MKKVLRCCLSLLMAIVLILPTTIQAQDVTTDTVLLGVINSFKEMNSLKGEYKGAMTLVYEEGTGDFTTEGDVQIKVSPEVEFGFDFDLFMDAVATDGSTENESLKFMTYLVGDKLHIFQDDSAEEDDGEWETLNASDIGYDTKQIAQQYQMIISMLEGVVRSYYIPSDVHRLLSEKTTIQSTDAGYTIVINSFETEEEWVAFFEALEKLESSTTEQSIEGAGVELEANLDTLDDIESQAKAIAESVTFTITITTDSNYFIESIDLELDTDMTKVDSSELSTDDSDTPQSVKAQFNYQLTDKNFDGAIDLPTDLPN